jgi:predicted dehydrogenase
MGIHIGIIGYQNHASRLRDIIAKNSNVKLITIYHPDKDKIDTLLKQKDNSQLIYTHIWSDLEEVDAYIIASPSETHSNYLKKIIASYIGRSNLPYIYCEKPCATSLTELRWLKESSEELYPKLFFGFNYRFSKISCLIKETLKEKTFGKPIYVNFNITHGLAYKNSVAENWRFTDSDIFSRISGNLGIHYIDLCISNFGKIHEIDIFEINIAGHQKPDTSQIRLKFKDNFIANIFLSYATVFSKEMTLFLSDAVLKVDEKDSRVFYPRDTYNLDGSFRQPVGKNYVSMTDCDRSSSGLQEIVSYFLKTVNNREHFKIEDFNLSLKSTHAVFSGFKIKK